MASASVVQDYLKSVTDSIDKAIDAYCPPAVKEQLTKLEEQQPMLKKAYVVGAGVTLPLLLIIYLLGGLRLITNLVGFVYPAFKSFKAIEGNSKDEDKQWLTYWIVYGVFNIIEHAMSFITELIPYYGFLKMALLIFCYHPQTLGASKVYDTVLSPYVVPMLVGKAGKNE